MFTDVYQLTGEEDVNEVFLCPLGEVVPDFTATKLEKKITKVKAPPTQQKGQKKVEEKKEQKGKLKTPPAVLFFCYLTFFFAVKKIYSQ